MGQVELIRLRLPRLTPRHEQPTIGGKAMHPGVTIAVGHVQVTRRGWHHLCGIVEGASGTGHERAGTLAAGIGMHTALPQYLERFSVQGIGETHGILPVGQIHDVVGNVDTMRIGEGANTPAAQVGAVPVKDHHWRLFALEDIDSVLRIGSDSAGIAERLSRGQLCPVFDEFIPIFARAHGCHNSLPSLRMSYPGSMARLKCSSHYYTVYSTIAPLHHPKINGLRSTATISPC